MYALADARLEQRIWMQHGHNTTYLTYTLSRATKPVSLTLTPLCTYRNYHSHTQGGWSLNIESIFDGDPPHTPRGAFAQAWSVAELLRA